MSDLRIYVADLADYNNGVLRGVWIDLPDSEEKVNEQIQAMLTEKPGHEEWAIHGHEGFGSLLSEHTGIESVCELAEEIDRHGEPYVKYAENMGIGGGDFEEDYQGEFDSEEAFAQQLVDDCYNLEKTMGNLACYFDYEKFARDLFLSDYWSCQCNGSTLVFRNS